jgi:PKD repeat protein
MLNSTISNSIVSGAVIINNIIYNGTISFNGTLYNATSNGTANLTSIIDYPPDAVLTAPATGMTASTILLNGSGSSDANIPGPMNDSLTYIFAFGDGSSYTESASNATDGAYDGMTTHAYPNAGNYTVTLTVIDIFGLSDSSTTTIRIDAPPPPPPPPPAGGGSGGGGYYFYGTVIYMNATNATNITVMAALNQTNATVSNQTGMCTESWACSGWTQCTSGLQTRTCSDLNNCSTTAGKPPETQFCGANQTGGQGALSLTAFLLANPVTAGAAVIAAIVILWLAYMAWQHFIRPKRHA